MDACCGDGCGTGIPIWLVCQLTRPHDGRYTTHGVFTTKEAAIACATNPYCFVFEATLDKEFEEGALSGAWYPMTQDGPPPEGEREYWPARDEDAA